MSGDRIDALAMMFRAGADVPPPRPAPEFPDWALQLMSGRRGGKTQRHLDEAAAANAGDRLAELARALNVPPHVLDVEAANHWATAFLPRSAQDWQQRAMEHYEKIRDELEAARATRVPCPPFGERVPVVCDGRVVGHALIYIDAEGNTVYDAVWDGEEATCQAIAGNPCRNLSHSLDGGAPARRTRPHPGRPKRERAGLVDEDGTPKHHYPPPGSCLDEYQPEHSHGSRPDACGTCSGAR